MSTRQARPTPAAVLAALVAGAVLGALLTIAVPGPSTARPVPAGTEAAPRAAYSERHAILGESVLGRPIHAWFRGDPDARRVLVVLGQMHGDEPAGVDTARWIRDHVRPRPGTGLWIVPTLNPDGRARGTRRNARGVDLNRNWPTTGWSSNGRGSETWGGPRPASEPETRAVLGFLRWLRPTYVASIHQPLAAIGRTGQDRGWERRLSRNLGLPVRHLGVGTPTGLVSPTLTGWHNSREWRRGTATTIEYVARPSHRYVTRVAGRGILRAARLR